MVYQHTITIEVVKGGFVLHYPEKGPNDPAVAAFGINTGESWQMAREIFSSSRKMNQRIKEVLEAVSTTPVEKDAD